LKTRLKFADAQLLPSKLIVSYCTPLSKKLNGDHLKSFKIKTFKIKSIKIIFRRKASPSIDSSGAKPPNFSQRQKTLTLPLTENAGHSPAFIYEAEGFVLK